MPFAKNQLIEALPRNERLQLLASCDTVDLVFNDVLFESGSPVRHVYFPVESFVSLLTNLSGKPVLEVGMVGHEGMVGAPVALGVVNSSLHARVQGPGKAWRISANAFREALKVSPALQSSIQCYMHLLMSQFATSAACQGFHQVEPRLARWLLMSQDRAGSADFHVTHEFLAVMLGVRRVGITAAASGLQRRGLITYKRGELTVTDRQGLESAACECYATNCKSYRSLFGRSLTQRN